MKIHVLVLKLYADKKINPFGGCLLLLIQIPLIYSMFFAIAQPVKFMYPELKDISKSARFKAFRLILPKKGLYGPPELTAFH